MTQVIEPVRAPPRALTVVRVARRVLRHQAGAAMTPHKIAARHRAGGSVEALRRMPLAARARIESETDALLLLARAGRRCGGDAEVQAAIAAIEELLAQIQADLIAARM